MSAENTNYLAPELHEKFKNFLTSQNSEEEQARVKAIYKRLIAEGNPTTEVKPKEVHFVDLSIFITRGEQDAYIDYDLIEREFGYTTSSTVQYASNAYSEIQYLRELIQAHKDGELPEASIDPEETRGLLNATEAFFSNLCNVSSHAIDIEKLFRVREDIKTQILEENAATEFQQNNA